MQYLMVYNNIQQGVQRNDCENIGQGVCGESL